LLCFPVGCGLKTIGVLHIIGTVIYSGLGALLFEIDKTAGAIMIVALVPMIVSTYFYIRFLADSENPVRRQHLVYALWLTFLSCVIGQIVEYLAVNAMGSINSKMVKISNASAPSTIAHPSKAQATTIARKSNNSGIGQSLINILVNLLWSYYMSKKVAFYATQAKTE